MRKSQETSTQGRLVKNGKVWLACGLAAGSVAIACLWHFQDKLAGKNLTQSPGFSKAVRDITARFETLKTKTTINFDFQDFLTDTRIVAPMLKAFDDAAAAQGYQRCTRDIAGHKTDLPMGDFGRIINENPDSKFLQISFTDSSRYSQRDIILNSNSMEPYAVVTYATRCP